MVANQATHFGLLPSADWNQLVQLGRFAGFSFDALLRHLMTGLVIGAAMLCLSAWNGPRTEQTQRRFDQDAAAFKSLLQTQIALSRQFEPDAPGARHQQSLVAWLDQQAQMPLRVRLFEENRGFPSQLLFDSRPATAVPSGPIWRHGVSHRLDIGGRTLIAELSPLDSEQAARSGGSLSEATLLLLVMGFALVLPFVLPQLTLHVMNLLTATQAARFVN
jgi:hypothetical protein